MNQTHESRYKEYRSGQPARKLSEVIERVGFVVVFVISCLAFFTNCGVVTSLVLWIWSLATGIAAVFIYKKTRVDPFLNPVMSLLAAYFWVALPVKAIASQMGSSRTFIDDFGIPAPLFRECLYPAIAYSFGGLIAIVVSFALLRALKLTKTKAQSRLNVNFILLILAFAIPMKFFIHYVMRWGVPGMAPQNVIPLVTGAAVMFCRLGIFHLITTLLFCGANGRLRGVNKFFVLAGLVTFVALDFGNGSKYSGAYIVVALSFILGDRVTIRRIGFGKSALIVSIILAVVVVLPIVHQYRFARMKRPNAQVYELVAEAIKRANAMDSYADPVSRSLIAFTKRINGFQNYCSARYYENRINLTWSDLINSEDSTRRYTEAVTRISGNVNAYGLTQLSVVSSLANNRTGVVLLYGAVFNAGLLLFVCCPVTFLTKDVLNLRAGGITLGLFVLHCQFSGGNFLFLGKQYLVICMTIWLAGQFRLAISRQTNQGMLVMSNRD